MHRRGLGILLRIGLATAIVGVSTGLAVLLLVWIVHTIEHLVWGHDEGPFLDRSEEHTSELQSH